jgi:hypothetical protein
MDQINMKKAYIVLLFLGLVGSAQTGIGTTTPAVKLHVKSNGPIFRLEGSDHAYMELFPQGALTRFGWIGYPSANAVDLTVANQSASGAFSINTNSIERFRITSAGQLGIGTSTPSTTLTVGNAAGTIPGEIMINPTATTNEGGQITIKRSLSGGTLDWTLDHFGTSNAEARFRIFGGSSETNGLIIRENGNIGIGTASPVDRLDVRSAMSVNEIKFRGTDGGDDTDPYRLRKFKIGNLNELQLHLNDDPNEQFTIYGNSCLTAGCPEYSTHLYHYFRSDGDVYHAGRVGIGTTSPAASLHVASSVGQSVGAYGFLNSAGAGSGSFSGTVSYSIQADQRIRAPEFNAVSDTRIKKDIVPLNTTKQLSDVNKLKVVHYSYIDQLANGNKIKTGFIAQDVEKVNTQFVNQSADFIPSVYDLAKSSIFKNQVLEITTGKPHGFIKGDVVKFFAEGKKEVIKTIDEVKNADSFTVTEWNEPTDNLFVYGKKVTDFRAIDFDQITALSVGAIQELSKQIQKLQLENAALNKLINNTIQTKQSELEKRLLQLESKLNKKKR